MELRTLPNSNHSIVAAEIVANPIHGLFPAQEFQNTADEALEYRDDNKDDIAFGSLKPYRRSTVKLIGLFDQISSKRQLEKGSISTFFSILEIDATKEFAAVYKKLTLRSLLQDINQEICSDLNSNAVENTDSRGKLYDELRMRDLRRLEFGINKSERFNVVIRRHVVLFTVDPLRAIVTSQKLRLIVPTGDSPELSLLENYMRDWFQIKFKNTSNLTFEMHVYESMLATVKDILIPLHKTLIERIRKILSYMKAGHLLSSEAQARYIFLSDESSKLEAKLKLYISSLKTIVDDDEAMALMNLTTLRLQPTLYRSPLAAEIIAKHEVVKDTLEDFVADITAILINLNSLDSATKIVRVSIKLDAFGNRAWAFQALMNAFLLISLFGTAFAGQFAMNLDNQAGLSSDIESSANSFVYFCVFTTSFMIVFCFAVYFYFINEGILPQENKQLEEKYMN